MECSDFIWDFRKLPFPSHLGKYFIKIGKISAKIHEIEKITAIFGLGMTPIQGLKNGQIKSLECDVKKDVQPNMTSECCSPVACWLFLAQYKHLTHIMYSQALSTL